METTKATRPRIGMLWGDFSSTSPVKFGKLWSMGRVAQNMTRALENFAEVIPFCPSEEPISFDQSSEAYQKELIDFLNSIDILLADLYPSSTFALTIRERLKIPCQAVLFAGGVLPKGAEAMLFPWQHLLHANDCLLFTSTADQAIWNTLVSWNKLREWVVPLAINEAVFYSQPVEERLVTREHYHLPFQAPLLLYVGRMNIQKNIHTLFYLLAAIRKQIPDTKLWLVGEEDSIMLGEFAVRNTGYIAWLQELAVGLGIIDAVEFLGPLFGEDLANIYNVADVVVNLSLYHRENFGLSQAEAAACGIPVVCSAWGGFKDVVEVGVTGYTVDTVLTKHGIRANWAQAVKPLVELLEQRTLRHEMSIRASSIAHERFSLDTLSRNLATIVSQIQSSSHIEDTQPAYQPSPFAAAYEAHKRECGWYDFRETSIWYPPLFQGEAYNLYETLIRPYATKLSTELSPQQIKAEWIPYFPSMTRVDSLRQLLWDEDPIWPHRSFFTSPEWDMIRNIDGRKALSTIAQPWSGATKDACTRLFWKLYIDGFILFATHEVSLNLTSQ